MASQAMTFGQTYNTKHEFSSRASLKSNKKVVGSLHNSHAIIAQVDTSCLASQYYSIQCSRWVKLSMVFFLFSISHYPTAAHIAM